MNMELKKGWDEMPIKMWQELNQVDRENELSVIIERISILADTDPESIRSLSIPEFKKAQSDIDWVSAEFKPEPVLTFELNGVRYGMIPDLNFISTGEWADIENWKDDSITNIHLICALIYRPITRYESDDDYEIEKHTPKGFTRRAELFLNSLPITTVYGAVLFFSASGLKFIEIIADYLEAEEKAQKKKMKKTTTQKASKKSK